MAGQLKVNHLQLGDSSTASNNFALSIPSTPDGSVKLSRGNVGETTQDIMKVTSSGAVSFPNGAAFSTRKNKIINGNFDIWQRGNSQTSSGYGSDDRWNNANVGSTKVHSKVALSLGQTDVPGNPKYYSQTVVTSVAGAGNYVFKQQAIESVLTLAGKTATLSFYAVADSAKDIAVELVQGFGTGGTPSANDRTAPQKVTLSSNFQKFELTFDIPSILGKTLGTDNNDHLVVRFWLDAGSDYDVNSGTLGQQSGTFGIAQVQLEEGSVATDFDQRTVGEELALCERYYEVQKSVAYKGYSVTGNPYGVYATFRTVKRGTPTMVYTDVYTSPGYPTGAPSPSTASAWTFSCYKYCNSTTPASVFQFNVEADAEL
jgi:hypothetical protein